MAKLTAPTVVKRATSSRLRSASSAVLRSSSTLSRLRRVKTGLSTAASSNSTCSVGMRKLSATASTSKAGMTATSRDINRATGAAIATATATSTTSTSTTLRLLSPFARLVYAHCRRIPRGRVASYSGLAAAIGHPRAYRAVGHALSVNPFAPHVPCHRVVAASGALCGFNGHTDPASSEVARKAALLRSEGVQVVGGRVQRVDSWSVMQLPALVGVLAAAEMTDAALAAPLTS